MSTPSPSRRTPATAAVAAAAAAAAAAASGSASASASGSHHAATTGAGAGGTGQSHPSASSAQEDSSIIHQLAACLFPCCAPRRRPAGDQARARAQPPPQSSIPAPAGSSLTRPLSRFWSSLGLSSSASSASTSQPHQQGAAASSSRLTLEDADENTPLLGKRPVHGLNGSSSAAGAANGQLGADAQQEGRIQRAPAVPLNPDVLRKITETTQHNFLVVSLAGPYLPEDLDRRSATSGGLGGGGTPGLTRDGAAGGGGSGAIGLAGLERRSTVSGSGMFYGSTTAGGFDRRSTASGGGGNNERGQYFDRRSAASSRDGATVGPFGGGLTAIDNFGLASASSARSGTPHAGGSAAGAATGAAAVGLGLGLNGGAGTGAGSNAGSAFVPLDGAGPILSAGPRPGPAAAAPASSAGAGSSSLIKTAAANAQSQAASANAATARAAAATASKGPTSDLERSMLARLEAESGRAGPLFEVWSDE
ncbi:hypothetical protein OC835_004683 [Tilletia horrida]|nr:hypothetical protein OC835_004683 [Tilletia horrida]